MPDYRTTTQMLRMVRLLQETYSGARPVNQLADELGVDRRTVVRWLMVLEEEWVDEQGAPIVRREHRSGRAWAVLTGARAPLSASIYQYAAAFAATQQLRAAGDTVLAEGAGDILDRVEQGLSESWRDAVPRVLQSFHYVPFAPKDHSASEDVLDGLVHALIRRHPVEVDYTNAAGATSRQRIEPWSLVMYRDGFYLLAMPPWGRKLLLYAVERMGRVEVDVRATFEVPSSFDPASAFGERLGLWRSDAEAETVRVAFAPSVGPHLRSRRWPGLRSLAPMEDGRVCLEMQVPVTPEITSWVLSWGAAAEVLEPASLRAMVAEELAVGLRAYET